MSGSDATVPDLTGRTAVVTGANSGLGLQVATVLAEHGARVIIGARNPARGAVARQRVAAVATGEEPELVLVDLGSLASVSAAATSIVNLTGGRLDILVNNAGVMAPPAATSEDGFETQWATNVLGAAALTWRLLPAIERAAGSRVVFVGSTRHNSETLSESVIRGDIGGAQSAGLDVYGRTKLADLILARELDKHFRRRQLDAKALAAHPGFSATSIVENGFSGLPGVIRPIANWGARAFGQPVEAGARPILFAATSPDAEGGGYYGPQALGGLRGRTGPAKRAAQSLDDDTGAMLVRVVSELIDVPPPN